MNELSTVIYGVAVGLLVYSFAQTVLHFMVQWMDKRRDTQIQRDFYRAMRRIPPGDIEAISSRLREIVQASKVPGDGLARAFRTGESQDSETKN